MGKRKVIFSETSPPPHPFVEIRITEVNPTLTRRNPTLELFPCMFPTPEPLVETPITQENPTLESNLTLELFTTQSPVSKPVQSPVTEPEPVQSPILEPVQSRVPEPEPVQSPILEPVQSHVPELEPVHSHVLEPTLFQFDSLFPQSIPPPQQSMHLPPREHARRGQQSEKPETIDIPFRWATNRRANVCSFHYLIQNEIFDITGDVECKNCKRKFEMSFDVREKFPEISDYILKNSQAMDERAPPEIWMNPTLPDCVHCNKKNCVNPIVADKKKKINWLFLFLGQMLGCCNLVQLRYCCKYNNSHRTGAKDRVLYSAYLALCNQLHSNHL
ncbi:uncharacterized protein LOC131657577 [Vicia villosa]|uniref:uncharacterized protein LOC131657577 n=1 Tax=Vicia villosa TaxID=3911 RepID=UPI00273C0038|nr:uncharacterized protein LOC131657577 [Vicia villosa]